MNNKIFKSIFFLFFLTVFTAFSTSSVHAMANVEGEVYKVVNGVRQRIITNINVSWPTFNYCDDQGCYDFQGGSTNFTTSLSGSKSYNYGPLNCTLSSENQQYTFTPTKPSGWGNWTIHQLNGFGISGSYIGDNWKTNNNWGNQGTFTVDFQWIQDIEMRVDAGCENNAPVNTITWNPNVPLDEYRVWRDGGGFNGWIAQEIPGNQRTYKDTNVTPGTTYTYKVWGGRGNSAFTTFANDGIGIGVTTSRNCSPPPVPQSLIIQQGPAGIGFQQGQPSTANYSRSGLTASQQGSNFYNDLTIQPTVSSVTRPSATGNLQYIATSFVPSVIRYNPDTPLSFVLNDVNRFGSFLVLYAHCGNTSVPCTAGNQPLSQGNYYIYSPRMNPNWRPLTTELIGDASNGLQAGIINSQVYNEGTQTLSPIFDIFIYKTFPNQVWNTYNHMKTVNNGQVVETNILAEPCDTNGNCASRLTEGDSVR